ncbi:hypothetical protein K435DRAFT_843351 [Dendrothele bispora CBS 962.96]|uniref:Mid2 domain-containing protein n=1 Tax=Dendrothele bispora (strain CBS 962.96) TaxID=1314807 RepID=A0A4S8L9F5_DENBC|nr:hypothetical protein K435DRAFT_843351 [Dendrothele bispora CBS 962.96]
MAWSKRMFDDVILLSLLFSQHDDFVLSGRNRVQVDVARLGVVDVHYFRIPVPSNSSTSLPEFWDDFFGLGLVLDIIEQFHIKRLRSSFKLVDDTDSRVQYSGQWNLTTGDTFSDDLAGGDFLNDLSSNGDVFNNTVHETRMNGTSFTFQFNGTSRIFVYGTTIASPPSANASGSSLPDTLLDGDTIQLGTTDTAVMNSPDVVYSSGWSPRPVSLNDAVSTTTPGSFVTVRFNGTSIQMYGELLVEQNSSNSATYQVDDSPPHQFGLFPPTGNTSKNWTHQRLVDIDSLSPEEEHTLVVKHNGSTTGMPLTIEYFLVNSLTQEQQASLTLGPNSTSPASPSANRHSRGEIIGGIVGGVVLLVILLALLWIWMKKRQRNQNRERDHLKPTSIVQFPYGAEFDPYSRDGSTDRVVDTGISLNPHKKSTNSTQQNSPVSTGREQNDELVSQLRWGNLKLQQQLATRGGHSLLQQDDSELEEHRRRARVHTDSGWRMGQDIASNEMELEVPPNYTEV